MDTLSLVTTGGTIAMTTGPDGIRRPATSDEVAATLTEIAGVQVDTVGLADIDSSQATPALWEELIAELRTQDASGADAVIVTHGTDSLAWTAGALAAAGGWRTPVVLTAANVPLGEAGSDAVANLHAAAAAARSATPGVYVAFAGTPDAAGEVFAGGFVRKVRAEGQAFAGLPQRCGVVNNGRFVAEAADDDPWGSRSAALPALASETFRRRVLVVGCHPAFDATAYLAVLDGPARPDAIVIETYACGTVPAGAVDLTRAATHRGIDVMACPPAPIAHAQYESTEALRAAGAQLHLGATVEWLVPAAASQHP